MARIFSVIGSLLGRKNQEEDSDNELEETQQEVVSLPDISQTAIVWLDDAHHDSEENRAAQEELRHFDSNLKIFHHVTECEEFINAQSEQSQIVLIVDGKLGQQIVSRVQQRPQIIGIYIYCMYKEFQEKWAKGITKVKKIVTQFPELRDDIQSNYFNDDSIAVVSPTTEQTQHQSMIFEPDDQYLISDICMDYLSQIETTTDEKDAFIQQYQSTFAADVERMANAQIFQESYLPARAVSWLTKDRFFQQILEVTFQNVNTNTMAMCAFFIRDIRNQFEQNKCTSTLTVYRSQMMREECFQQLKNAQGKIITYKSFFSTTINRNVALIYLSEQNEYKRVLFEIEANPEIPGVKPFMKLDTSFDSIDETEVLFMLGALFRINEIRNDETGLTIVKMSLCAHEKKDEILKQLPNLNEKNDLIGFTRLQFELGRILNYPNILYDIDTILQRYLTGLPDDHSDRIRCYDQLASLALVTEDFDLCIDQCEKSLEMKKKILSLNDPKLILSYDLIVYACSKKNDKSRELDALKQILNIHRQNSGDRDSNLVPYYTRMIQIYESEQKFTDVLLCYNQIYSILLNYFTIDDLQLASVYHNLGNTFVNLVQYPLALGYYQTALNIKLKHQSATTESVASSYRSIAFVYKDMGDIEQARVHFQKAVNVYEGLGENCDAFVLEIKQLMESLSLASV